MLSHDCQIRVWYKHTDQMAICHHSNYICYYEAARSEFLRAWACRSPRSNGGAS